MPMDFPNSPTVGQVFQASNGATWQWDGTTWNGGQISAPQVEQFFTLDGLTYCDIPVPAWAKAAQFSFSVQVGGGATYFCARLSFDGTTFMAGATDYMNGGPVLNSGSAAYAAFGQQAASVIMLGVQGDNAGFPHQGEGVINVLRAAATAVPWRCSTRVLDGSAAAQHRTWETSGYLNTTPNPNVLTVKALRFLRSDGAVIAAGSWLRIRWLGDMAALPVTNSVVMRDYWAAATYTPGTTVLGLGDDRKVFGMALGAGSVFTLPTGMPAGWSVLLQATGSGSIAQANYVDGGANVILFKGKNQLLGANNRMVLIGRNEILRFTWSAGNTWVAECVQDPSKGMFFQVSGTGAVYNNSWTSPSYLSGGGAISGTEAAPWNCGMVTPATGVYAIHGRCFFNADGVGGALQGLCYFALGNSVGYDSRFNNWYVWKTTGGQFASQTLTVNLEQGEINCCWMWTNNAALVYLPSNNYYFASLVSR